MPSTEDSAAQAAVIAARFALPAAVRRVEPYGDGLINTTFLVSTGTSRYVLQRINDSVFPQPLKIMSNLEVLEKHLSCVADPGLRIPALIRTSDGLPFAQDRRGGTWRLIEFIPNSRVLRRIQNLAQAREVGCILGRFHRLVGGLPPDRFEITLPGFHETPRYLEELERTLAASRSAQPAELASAIAFVDSRRARARVLEEARRQGRIPDRVIHGDPKLDNILFDRAADRALSLVDMDTMQPGLVHHDLADCLRSCCNRTGESADLGKAAVFDLNLCRTVLAAYADETKGMLNTAEIDLVASAIHLIPFELGVRFLIDHLQGDRYFRVTEPGQNLRKARIQFALVQDIEAKQLEIAAIVAGCFGRGPDDASVGAG